MFFTFLGHQTWYVEGSDGSLLIDPVIDDHFGHTYGLNFTIWPPRHIDPKGVSHVRFAVLTHEHVDHLHFPSLKMLHPEITILVGPLMPQVVVDAVREAGLRVKVLSHEQPFAVGSLSVELFGAGAGTVSWEKRVSQVLIADVAAPDNQIFIPVDALASEVYARDVARGARPKPRAVVLANNSQVCPPGAPGAYNNILPDVNSRSQTKKHEVLDNLRNASQLQNLNFDGDILICGNGYLNPRAAHGPFMFSDHHEIADELNEATTREVFFGPYPGETIQLEDTGAASYVQSRDWVTMDAKRHAAGLESLSQYLQNQPHDHKIGPLAETALKLPSGGEDDDTLLERELDDLGRRLISTPLGQRALSTHNYLNGPVGPYRFALVLEDLGGRSIVYAWNINTLTLDILESDLATAVRTVPFGVRIFKSDLLAVLRSDLQIWDLAGTAMESWYLGDTYSSGVAALFNLYGEQARPDLAHGVYRKAIQRAE